MRLLLSVAVTFLGLLLVTFLIGRVVPIDPVLAAVGDRAPPDVYERVKVELGLDQPLWRQFAIYVGQVLQGDLGDSVLTARPVLEDILRVFPATLELATVAIVLGVVFGVPMGVLGAVKQGRWPDHVVRVLGLVGYSVPVFWLGLMGLLLFYAKLGWVEGPGRLDVFYEDLVPTVTGVIMIDALIAGDLDVFRNAFDHVILPAAVLGYFSLAYIARMTRSLMLEQLSQEYITTARVKGVPEWRVIWRHALGNTLVPLVTVIALAYGNLLEGSVLTETVFAWPGLGAYLTSSLLNADMNAVLGSTLVVGTVFIGLNLLSDLLYRLLDPRAADMSASRAWLLAETPASALQARLGQAYLSWLAFRRNPLALVGLAIVLLLVVVAAAAPLIATQSPLAQDLAARLQPPGAVHWLGTDELGRDIYSRIVWGARLTLVIVLLVAVIVGPVGLLVGTVAGYAGGWADTVLMRTTDVFLAFPRLILALAFVAALGPGIENAIIAIAITAWPPYARIARAETLTIRHSDFIAAARLQGASAARIIAGHVVPMCVSSLIVRLTLDMAGIILIAAGLGFLGLGAQPPAPEWGSMISTGRQYVLDHWWVATMPGLAIVIVSLGFNLLGDGLRDVLDPKQR